MYWLTMPFYRSMNTKKEIAKVRPKLYDVDPKSSLICWSFVVFNILLGIYFLKTDLHTLRVPIVTGLFNNSMWGSIFLLLGVWLFGSLLNNDWNSIRYSMIAGLFVKAFWMYALVVVALQVGWLKTLASLTMWAFIFTIQAITVIHFLPKEVLGIKDRSGTVTL
jgi:hypothetical protein